MTVFLWLHGHGLRFLSGQAADRPDLAQFLIARDLDA
jgi:hypothetical protein